MNGGDLKPRPVRRAAALEEDEDDDEEKEEEEGEEKPEKKGEGGAGPAWWQPVCSPDSGATGQRREREIDGWRGRDG